MRSGAALPSNIPRFESFATVALYISRATLSSRPFISFRKTGHFCLSSGGCQVMSPWETWMRWQQVCYNSRIHVKRNVYCVCSHHNMEVQLHSGITWFMLHLVLHTDMSTGTFIPLTGIGTLIYPGWRVRFEIRRSSVIQTYIPASENIVFPLERPVDRYGLGKEWPFALRIMRYFRTPCGRNVGCC